MARDIALLRGATVVTRAATELSQKATAARRQVDLFCCGLISRIGAGAAGGYD